ncbi:MAG: BLUF domain-containing protein [Devosiaceae bacterium]|nr:BLUF domain-containing protein [Devosiaceae bacterium MH13]
MPLYAITYISRAPEVRGENRKLFLNSLIKQADAKNLKTGVSGCLIHVDDFFIQLLEGPRGPLSETYNRIVQDERHSEVNLVAAGPILTRQFTSPNLAAFDIASETNPVFLKFRVRPEFCPYQIAPDALAGLIEQIAIVCARLDTANRKGRDKAA